MACSAILVLDLKGRVLLARDYRGDIPLKYADRFIAKVNELEDAGKLTPVIVDEGVTYLYVQVSIHVPNIVSRVDNPAVLPLWGLLNKLQVAHSAWCGCRHGHSTLSSHHVPATCGPEVDL